MLRLSGPKYKISNIKTKELVQVYYTVDGGPFVGDGKHSTRRKPSTKANVSYVCVKYISL